MEQEEKDLLARVLDMNEMELRATLITIIRDMYDTTLGYETKQMLKNAIDAAYNPIRRTGVRW